MRTAICIWCLFASVAFYGCGAGSKLKTYPVKGKVTWHDGKPLAGGVVTFHSLDHKVSASGSVESDGTCRLGTYKPADGAVAGRHRVAVAVSPIQGDPDQPVKLPGIAAKYNNPDTSGLEHTVTPGQNGEFAFEVGP